MNDLEVFLVEMVVAVGVSMTVFANQWNMLSTKPAIAIVVMLGLLALVPVYRILRDRRAKRNVVYFQPIGGKKRLV